MIKKRDEVDYLGLQARILRMSRDRKTCRIKVISALPKKRMSKFKREWFTGPPYRKMWVHTGDLELIHRKGERRKL